MASPSPRVYQEVVGTPHKATLLWVQLCRSTGSSTGSYLALISPWVGLGPSETTEIEPLNSVQWCPLETDGWVGESIANKPRRTVAF